jgi:hypothetical protein
MKISELIAELETAKANFGDTAVCIAQQRNGTVRLTGISEVYFQHGTTFVTNMNADEIAATVDQ